jgi:phosphoglycolate phosphatase-like HAD superfamily hydrolase
VAFDVDGTLIGSRDLPIRGIVHTLFNLKAAGARIIVWSGGGREYAESIGRRLGLPPDIEYRDKPIAKLGEQVEGVVDLAFDNEFVKFGKVNFKV